MSTKDCLACAFQASAPSTTRARTPDMIAFAFVVGLAHGREAREHGIPLCVEHAYDLEMTAEAFRKTPGGPAAPTVRTVDIRKPQGSA